MSYLGIDIGSSGVKAVAFRADGTQLASAHARYQYTVPEPNAMELDGNAVLEAAFKVLSSVAEATRGSDPVEAISFSSQGEAFSALSSDGRILAPAMISGDSRAAADMADFTREFGLERLYRLTGHTPSAMFSLAKLLYMKRRSPELYAKAAKFLCFEDLLSNALGGRPCMGWFYRKRVPARPFIPPRSCIRSGRRRPRRPSARRWGSSRDGWRRDDAGSPGRGRPWRGNACRCDRWC